MLLVKIPTTSQSDDLLAPSAEMTTVPMSRKSMLRFAVSALAILCPNAAHCEVTSESFCFESDSKTPVKFELHTYYDSEETFSSGYVIYNKQQSRIPLVLGSRSSDETAPGRPDMTTDKWLEVVDGAVTGSYDMVSQGSELVSMSYTNLRNKKKIGFALDPNALGTPGDNCGWKK